MNRSSYNACLHYLSCPFLKEEYVIIIISVFWESFCVSVWFVTLVCSKVGCRCQIHNPENKRYRVIELCAKILRHITLISLTCSRSCLHPGIPIEEWRLWLWDFSSHRYDEAFISLLCLQVESKRSVLNVISINLGKRSATTCTSFFSHSQTAN